MTRVNAGADRPSPGVRAEDMDALHVLPLAIVPLATTELRQARIVKDAQLRGVIELWGGEGMGSGRVLPSELPKMFDLRGARRNDLVVIKHLCRLPSYDVFSLRVSLKELGIKVEN